MLGSVKSFVLREGVRDTREMKNDTAPHEGIADDFAAIDTERPFGSYLSVINGGA